MMNRTTKQLLLGYGIFCAVNAGVAYFWGRNQTPGTNKLADINNALLRVNLLSYLLPEATSGAAAPGIPAAPSGATVFPVLSAPQVTETAGGTTTYFGS